MRRLDIAKPLRPHNKKGLNHLHPRAPGTGRKAIGYPAGMSFKPDELALLEEAEEVDIETQAPAGPVHRATIWIVVDGGSAYVRSVRGPAGRWYRELQANPAGAIHVGRRRLPTTAVPAADPDSVERGSAP